MNEAITPAAASPTTALTDLALQKDVADPSRNQLDKDSFLKLLVAQLKYQDPLDPSDPAEFMSTTAQFTTIEKLDELTTQGANNAIVSGLSMASSLVGRQVNFVGADGSPTSGVVSSAEVFGGDVRLSTTAGPVALGDVLGIGLADDGSASTRPSLDQPTESAPTPASDNIDPPNQPPENPQDDQSIDPPIDRNTDSQQGTADGTATPQQEVNTR